MNAQSQSTFMRLPKTQILETVCGVRSVTLAQLRGPSRSTSIVWARHECAAFLREFTSMSSIEIGRFLGGRDHSAALNSIVRVERRRAEDAEYADELAKLRSRIVNSIARPDHSDAKSPRRETITFGQVGDRLLVLMSILSAADVSDSSARAAGLVLAREIHREIKHD